MLILIDTNIPMYVWGKPHSLSEHSRQVLRLSEERPQAFFTDAEVLQEMLHRYIAVRQWPAAGPAIVAFAKVMSGRIEPLFGEDVLHAAKLADCYPALSARDLIHVAIAVRAGATHIVSADTAFDVVTEIERLDPLRVAEWRGEVSAQ